LHGKPELARLDASFLNVTSRFDIDRLRLVELNPRREYSKS